MRLFGALRCYSTLGIVQRGRQRGTRQTFRATVLTAVSLSVGVAIHLAVAMAKQPGAHAAPVTYTMAITPQFEQRRLHAVWQPIADELERHTGFHFRVVSRLTIQEYDKAYRRGEFDFVYPNPYNIVLFHDVQPYIPLVADKTPIRGIVVVRKDGPIKTLADLDGKTVAFPAPNALGASLMVRSELDRIRHLRITPLFVKTHSSVYLHVATGLVAAGGGVEKTLKRQNDAIRAQLKVVYVTRDCPSLPLAAHPRVPTEVREKVRKALLALNNTQGGKEMLERVPVKQLIPVSFKDYAIMNTWGLDKYSQKEP